MIIVCYCIFLLVICFEYQFTRNLYIYINKNYEIFFFFKESATVGNLVQINLFPDSWIHLFFLSLDLYVSFVYKSKPPPPQHLTYRESKQRELRDSLCNIQSGRESDQRRVLVIDYEEPIFAHLQEDYHYYYYTMLHQSGNKERALDSRRGRALVQLRQEGRNWTMAYAA